MVVVVDDDIRAKNGSFFLLLLLLFFESLGPEVGLAVDEVAGLDDLGAGPVGDGTALSVAGRDTTESAPEITKTKIQIINDELSVYELILNSTCRF